MKKMRMPRRKLIGFIVFVLFALGSQLMSRAQGYQPFFDEDPTTRHAPADPEMTDLDLDVLLLCGDWGDRVEARDFERLLMKEEHQAVVTRIRKAVGSRVYSSAGDNQEFVRQLRRAWFEQLGFKHVFCGEPGIGKDLGGLHFAARFWQAQDEGWAGYRKLNKNYNKRTLDKCRKHYLKESVNTPIFNISIAFENPKNPQNTVKCLGGYHLQMDTEKILIAGTQAFKQANRRVGKNTTAACTFETKVEGVDKHYSKLVVKSRAIRTFYALPEKKPYCREKPQDFKACLCSRL